MWQDAFENGKDDLDEGTIIEVWKDWGHPGWKGMLKKVRNTDNLKKYNFCQVLIISFFPDNSKQSFSNLISAMVLELF